MIYIVQRTRPGHFAPDEWRFWEPIAAEHWADILRTNGHHHVTTHQLDATEQRENT